MESAPSSGFPDAGSHGVLQVRASVDGVHVDASSKLSTEPASYSCRRTDGWHEGPCQV